MKTSAKLKSLGTYNIPQWAIVYMEYGDSTSLIHQNMESDLIDSWMKVIRAQFNTTGLMFSWSGEKEYTSFPEFGFACDTEKCEVFGYVKDLIIVDGEVLDLDDEYKGDYNEWIECVFLDLDDEPIEDK